MAGLGGRDVVGLVVRHDEFPAFFEPQVHLTVHHQIFQRHYKIELAGDSCGARGTPAERALHGRPQPAGALRERIAGRTAGQQGVNLRAQLRGGGAGRLAGSECVVHLFPGLSVETEIARQVVLPRATREQRERRHGGVTIVLAGDRG